MRRLALLSLFACACASSPALAPTPAPAPARTPAPAAAPSPPECLSIVSWNDLHGQLDADHALVDTTVIPVGGVVAVADEVARVRASGDAVVVLDAGDLFTGPLESSIAEGAPVITAYNAIGVDAAAIGNHEFDFGPVGYARVTAAPNIGDEAGPDGPRGALLARMGEARFPFVSANITRKDGKPLAWPHLSQSVQIARGGYHVGVVGYTTRETPTTTMKPNVADLDFTKNAGARVASAVRALRAAGASPVVLLAHASIEGDLPESLDGSNDSNGDKRIGEIPDLLDAVGPDKPDLVIGGHRHAWMLGRVRGVPMVTSDQHGSGVAVSRFCRDGSGQPRLASIVPVLTIAGQAPRTDLGRAVAGAIAPALASVKAQAEEPVATIAKTCLPQATDGTALSEQIARAIAEHAPDAIAPPKGVPVVGVMNSGGIRAPVRAGTMHFADLFAVSPFENQVAVCATTKAGVLRALSNATSRPSAKERFPFGIAGAKITLERKPDSSLAVTKLTIDRAAKDDDPVWLALPDFLLWGGDDFLAGVTCKESAVSTLRLRDAWRGVIAKEGACDGPPKNVVVERR